MPSITVAPQDGRSYEVLIEAGALRRLPALVPAGRGTIGIIADDRVFGLHGVAVEAALRGTGRPVIVASFAAGEASKTRETKAGLEDALLDAGLGRDGVVVGLGGGVATDLAGFVAATILRGVAFIAAPTTLLAMVDASIGGKTGVNHRLGKNLIGAFHQPRAVVADLDVLATLPAAELDCGLAEMVKHVLVGGDEAGLDRLVAAAPAMRRLELPALADEVARSASIKARYVALDAREAGARAALNAGHTIGHGIERASGYGVSHGSAVAIGLVAEALAASRLGVLEERDARRVREAVIAAGLPDRLPAGVSPARVLEATAFDKKRLGGEPRFSLLAAIGRPARDAAGAFTIPVPPAITLEALEQLA
jgi:3-dehydroquinate synthase